MGNGLNSSTFRPGIEFKNGKLLEFERYSLTVMRPWPEPLAWRRTTRKPFRPVRSKSTLVYGPDDGETYTFSHDLRNTERFMEPVPPDVTTKIGQFTNRQWHMMALFARCPGALDLVQSTPALAFALASNWVFSNPAPSQPLRSARRMVRLPQTAICDWLGFPARPSTIHIMRKMRIKEITVEALLYLRDGLWNEAAAKLLRHCPVISRRVIAIATIPGWRQHFSPRFLFDLPKYDEGGELYNFDSTCALEFLLLPQTRRLLRPLQRFDSTAQVERYLEQFHRARRMESRFDCPPDLQFPQPPVHGTNEIIPFKNGWDLLAESKEMDHCVADLYRSAAEGRASYYRVNAPERATLSLIRENDIWQLGEVHGRGNARVTRETYAAIYAWLSVATQTDRARQPFHGLLC